MTFKKFIGIIGFLLSIAVAGSSSWFLDGVTSVDSVFYSRLFVLMIVSFVSGWLIGEGFNRGTSFKFALWAMILGTAGALSHELFFVVRQTTDTSTFKFLVNAAINGTLVSSFVLFGRNSCALRFEVTGESEEDSDDFAVQTNGSSDELSANVSDEEVVSFEYDEVSEDNEQNREYESESRENILKSEVVDFSVVKEGAKEISHANSEKEPIFEATFFEKNGELIVEKAKLEAQKIMFEAQQELQKMKNEKEKLENELKMLVNTEKQLLEQYKNQMQ